jgi:hypothetical protein
MPRLHSEHCFSLIKAIAKRPKFLPGMYFPPRRLFVGGLLDLFRFDKECEIYQRNGLVTKHCLLIVRSLQKVYLSS